MATDDPLRKLSEHENLSLGIATGVIEQMLTQPLLYWKNSFIQGLPFTVNPKLLYRGTAASVGNMSFTTGVQFYFGGLYQKMVTGGVGIEMTYSQEIGTAFMGGATSGPICSVMELVMIQQQRFGGSVVATCSRLVKEEGVSCLLRGSLATSGREAFYTAGYLGIVPATQRYLTKEYALDPLAGSFLGASVGGLACAAITQPLDTAKTCMQGDVKGDKYKTVSQTLRTLHQEYGSVRAMYRGYWWRGVYIIIDFLLLDYLKNQIAPVMFPEKCK